MPPKSWQKRVIQRRRVPVGSAGCVIDGSEVFLRQACTDWSESTRCLEQLD